MEKSRIMKKPTRGGIVSTMPRGEGRNLGGEKG
jgi:hypothetical protein